MRLPLFLVLIICLPNVLTADADQKFVAGTIQLSEGDYEAAIQTFQSLAEVHASPQVYYNLALAQQQLDRLGESRLSYERALILNPRFADARHNLNYLLSNTGLQEETSGTIAQLASLLSLNSWIWLASFAFWLWVILRLLDHFQRYQHWSAALLRFAAILVFAGASTFAFMQRHTVQQAIIVSSESPLQVAPTRESPLLRELVEADKVKVLAEHGSFYRIRLSDGQEGFAEQTAIERIIPASRS